MWLAWGGWIGDSSAAITRWDNGQVIPGTEAINPGPDMKANNRQLDFANLKDLSLPRATFRQSVLNNADLSGSELFFVDLSYALVGDTKFENAVIEAVRFQGAQGLTPQQLYSTRSYTDRLLYRIDLSDMNVAGWNFAQQELIEANFARSQLAGTDFSQAEIVGASFVESANTGWTADQLYSTASYKRGDLHAVQLGNNLLNGWNFTGQNLTFASFQGADLRQVNFNQAVLGGATFDQAKLTDVTAQQADLSAAKFRQTIWPGADLRTAKLGQTVFFQADLQQARFDGADLQRTTFHRSNLTGASFRDAVLYRNSFENTTASGFTFEQLATTRSYRDHSLTGIDMTKNDLTGWNFRSQDLTGAVFSAAILKDTDFTDAIVQGVVFPQIGTSDFTIDQLYATRSYRLRDLSGVQLNVGKLPGAQFAKVRLADASFDGADLTGADFTLADLQRAKLPANTTNAKFVNADLRGAKFITNQLLKGDFTGADMRRAVGNVPATRNLIGPSGLINGLKLQGSDLLVVRNDLQTSIRVQSAMTMSADSTLEFRLDGDEWGSRLNVMAPVVPQLNGTLKIDIEQQTDPTELVGQSFQLFAWNSPLAGTNQFAGFSLPAGTQWDLSQVYATGVVQLTGYMASDLDSDRDTDSADLLVFLANWTGSANTGPPTTRWQGDRDVDGDIDSGDLLEFLAGWTGAAEAAVGDGGDGLSDAELSAGRAAVVPEPAGTGWLLVLSVLAVGRARKTRPGRWACQPMGDC
ncbi:MAG: pentapeptide repeat-containing protein [Pirellulales bacterium]